MKIEIVFISICIGLIMFFFSIDAISSKIEKDSIKKAGGVDRFLKSKGFGKNSYEKFKEYEFHSIGVSDIYSFYERNGYEIQITSDRGSVTYHAIKRNNSLR